MKPIINNNKPTKVSLEIGKTYKFCRCGRSTEEPFCDSLHGGTEFRSLPFIAEKTEVNLCSCKQSKNLPYCDGTHKAFTEKDIGCEAPNEQIIKTDKI